MTNRKDYVLPQSARSFRGSKKQRLNRPPKDTAFVWMTLPMMESPAFRSLSNAAQKVINRIMVEHMHHAGTENGNLIVPYIHFEQYGVPRNSVTAAIHECEFMGLIRVNRGRVFKGEREPNLYRLTWFPRKDGGEPTNEWRGIGEPQIKLFKRTRKSDAAVKRRRAEIRRAKAGEDIVNFPAPGQRNSPKSKNRNYPQNRGSLHPPKQG